MGELVNTAIQKYCVLLARRHGIKDLNRIRRIIEKTLITFDYKKSVLKMLKWDGSQNPKLLESYLQSLKYFPPLVVDCFRKYKPKDESVIIDLLIPAFNFTPSLEEALNFLPNDIALELFEKEDLTFLSKKENFINKITKSYLFYTLDELANVLDDFIVQLKQNSEFIIKTGYPSHFFYKHKYLDMLSRCYYTRCPQRIEFYDPLSSNSSPALWIRYSKSKFWDLINFIPTHISYTKNFLLKYKWEKGKYEEASLIEGLPSKEAKILEDNRGLVFRFKLQILNCILQYLRNKGASDLWKSCFKIFLDNFPRDVFSFFLNIDFFYESSEKKELEVFLKISNIEFPYRRTEEPYLSGGVRHIFEAVKYFEKEIKIGTFSRPKAILNKIPKNIPLVSYYQSVNQPWQTYIDLAHKTFLMLVEEEDKFNKEFNERVTRDIINFLKIKVSFPIELKYLPIMSKFYKTIKLSEEKFNIVFHMTPIISPPSAIKKREPHIRPFPIPPGITWPDISIRFVSDKTVQVRAGSVTEVRNFIEMGFEDKRTHNPDLAWWTLKLFGKYQGEISWADEGINTQMRNKLKSRVKDIRKRLKFLFGLEDEPFDSYRRVKAYRVKFSILVRANDQE